jgi:GTP-binding protein HflX
MLVVNKADVDPLGAKYLASSHSGAVAVSARTGEGIEQMLRALGDRLRGLSSVTELLVPFERGDVLAMVHREGEVLVESPTDAGMRVRARLDEVSVTRLRDYVVTN